MLTLKEAAEFFGIKYVTLVSYKARGWLPPPDRVVARSPLWRRSTLTEWQRARPGMGVNGGQPSHKRNQPTPNGETP
jgi:hypothetical protein